MLGRAVASTTNNSLLCLITAQSRHTRGGLKPKARPSCTIAVDQQPDYSFLLKYMEQLPGQANRFAIYLFTLLYDLIDGAK